jgi:hypothetical protein
VDHDPFQSRDRACPRCGAPSITLPWFVSRRRTPWTCTDCGAKLMRVLPGLPYYTLNFAIAILTEVSILPLLFLAFSKKWGWVIAVITSLVIINLGVSAFLNRMTRVEFADPADGRRDKPGRWYPG